MENKGNLLGALLIGAGIGTILGILIAPDKGSITRVKITESAKKLGENLKTKVTELRKGSVALEHKNRQEFYDKVFSEGDFSGS